MRTYMYTHKYITYESCRVYIYTYIYIYVNINEHIYIYICYESCGRCIRAVTHIHKSVGVRMWHARTHTDIEAHTHTHRHTHAHTHGLIDMCDTILLMTRILLIGGTQRCRCSQASVDMSQ